MAVWLCGTKSICEKFMFAPMQNIRKPRQIRLFDGELQVGMKELRKWQPSHRRVKNHFGEALADVAGWLAGWLSHYQRFT